MRNTIICYLLYPLLAGLSFSTSAAPENTVSELSTLAVGTNNQPARLDLNKADAFTLQKELNGIGRSKAEAIVEYRENHGPFSSVEELLEIKGIGKALLDRNREKLMIE
ncbi:ComEA family DNA-binding protein [Pseudomonas sp. TE50-2]|uniref:ComEA family DNA-binding protein n=1 Tax=Pseudomonas sp. TE50-2 TaxID=3142707 RepID=UPI0034662E96